MMELLPFGVFFVFMVVMPLLVVGLFVLAFRREKQRREGLARIAEELSFSFQAADDEGLLTRFGQFELCSVGRSRRAFNCLRGETQNVAVTIFDYRYRTGSGKNSSTHTQTVVGIESEDLDLPQFSLQPEHFFHRLLNAFGYQDVDFGDFPEFSRKYLLRGQNEEAVRQLFTAPVVAHFEPIDGLSAEGRGKHLLVYRSYRRVPVDEIRRLLEEAFGVYSQLKSATPAST